MVREQEDGLGVAVARYTVGEAVDDWLEHGLGRLDESTATKYRSMARRHIQPFLGARQLRELTAREVDAWLAGRAEVLSPEPLRRVHACLNRAVRRAMARDLVARNVVALSDLPRAARPGRPSKSLTPEQVDQILTLTASDPMHAYIVVSLLTGGRTEELRALRWEHVHLDPGNVRGSVVPPYLEVWRSVRRSGDTKTRRSRRTLALPGRCVDILRRHRSGQNAARLAAGDGWKGSGLVFTTEVGTAMDPANVRRDFRRALRLVPGLDASEWTPRELRHSFVSVLSDAGVPLEEISRLVGHSGTAVTELVYRHQLRPVLQTGATVMDELFSESRREVQR